MREINATKILAYTCFDHLFLLFNMKEIPKPCH
jgi:hypothetical protein